MRFTSFSASQISWTSSGNKPDSVIYALLAMAKIVCAVWQGLEVERITGWRRKLRTQLGTYSMTGTG